jgi:hypothetical protein
MYSVASSPSRRFNSRLMPERAVWVCWQCNGREDISRVRDLSLGGLFLETKAHRAVGVSTKIDFLVDEGQIRAEAVVRHIRPGNGLGLKFTALTDQDRPRLAALLRRLRNFVTIEQPLRGVVSER